MKSVRYANLPSKFKLALKKQYVADIHVINVSSSFLPRARCKVCGQGPAFYFKIHKPYMYNSANDRIAVSKIIRGWIDKFIHNWYLAFYPKSFKDMKEFKISFDDIHYTPVLHRTRGANISDKDNVIDVVSCNCGETTWAYNIRSVKNRPEITNRKGKYSYPQKFNL